MSIELNRLQSHLKAVKIHLSNADGVLRAIESTVKQMREQETEAHFEAAIKLEAAIKEANKVLAEVKTPGVCPSESHKFGARYCVKRNKHTGFHADKTGWTWG